MNREIKFKCFFDDNDSMHEVESILFNDNGEPFEWAVDVAGEPFLLNELSGPLLQFTGLKDSKGVDIYEGDILEFDSSEWGSTKGNVFAVSWDLDNGGWDTGGGTNSECKEWKTIIGNIHENPELLN